MKLQVHFDVEPLLLIADESFLNKSMLVGCRHILFGNKIPEDIGGEDLQDKRLNWVCDQIEKIQKADHVPFLVVQQNLIPAFTDSGIRLISHIRLSKNEAVSQLPIVILTASRNERDTPKIYEDWVRMAPLYSKGVRYTSENDLYKRYSKNDSLLVQEIERLYAELSGDGKNEVDTSQFTEYENPQIPITKPTSSSHQVTNEWGAYRLAQAAGLMSKNNQDKLKPIFKYPEHLYFTYLQRSSEEPNPIDKNLFSNKVNSNLNILLIDDNYQKGWKNVIEQVLNSCLLSEKNKATIHTLEYANSVTAILEEKDGKRDIDKFDIVYLDLRLPENKENRNNPLPEQGVRVLKEIKAVNPTIPVIIFTASTKATNMDDLYELGVDGYFVKESPETRNDPNFSQKNLEGFVKTTRNCFEKGNLLKPYWKRIQEIKDNNLIKSNERDNGNGKETKFEERVIERLTMFIGLLKKAFEQTKFDQDNFLYDHYETAFLTLWSCLNDLSEFYYKKDQPGCILANGTRRAYLNSERKKHFRWRLGNDIFVEYDYNKPSDKKQISPLKWNGDDAPLKYHIIQVDSTRVDYERVLHTQIAFIILNKFNAGQDRSLQNMLNNSNNIRNKLTLTHSSDGENDNDICKTLRELRESTELNTNTLNHLFYVVFVLVTGRRIYSV